MVSIGDVQTNHNQNKTSKNIMNALATQTAELEAAKAKLQAAEQKLTQERNNALSKLHTDYGFATPDDFLVAYRNVVRVGGKGKGGKTVATGKRKARTSILPETREAIKMDLKKEMPALEVAKKYGISIGTVQNIKNEAGLVQSRS